MANLEDDNSLNSGESSMNAALEVYQEFEAGLNENGLNQAICFMELSVEKTTERHPEMLMRINNLMVMLKQRYEMTAEPADIVRAVEVTQLAVNIASSVLLPEDPERHSWIAELGSLKWMLYRLKGEPKLLDEAILSLTELVTDSIQDNARLSGRLTNLSLAYAARFRIDADRADIDVAVRHAERAVNMIARSDPLFSVRSSNLATVIMSRFEAYGVDEDLTSAIAAAQSAVDNAKENDPHNFKYQTNLGSMLFRQYDRLGENNDFLMAEEKLQRVIEGMPTGNPGSAALLGALASILGRKYERTGELSWLEMMIEQRRKVVQLLPMESPSLSGAKNNLAIGLLECYTSIGRKEDLEQAIEILRELVESVPANSVELPTILLNLSNGLDIVYEYSGEMAVLDRSIAYARQVIDVASKRNQRQPGRLAALGQKLNVRYRRSRIRRDRDEAVKLLKMELELYPNDPKRASWLADLAIAIDSLDQDTEYDTDLEKTIGLLEEELKASKDQLLHLPQQLVTLANRLLLKHSRTANLVYLLDAIRFGERAANLTSKDSPQLATVKNNLGYSFELLYGNSGREEELQKAIDCFIDAWRSECSVPFHRVMAAGRSIRLLGLSGNFKKGAEIAKEVTEFLPTLSAGVRSFSDRIYTMSTYSGIAANTCALLLASGQVIEALEYMQKGRAVILRDLQDSRAILQMRMHDEQLVKRFEDLRNKINAPIQNIENSVILAQAVKRRKESTHALQLMIENDIRKIPGLSQFRLGQGIEEMHKEAEDGPLVVINISDLRSDAVIVTSTEVRAIDLPLLKAEDLRSLLLKQWSGLRHELGIGNKRYRSFLSWLWDNGIGKIMMEIESILENCDVHMPRVRWIGSGLATSLPFHAAGYHHSGSTDNVMSKVISSYASFTRFPFGDPRNSAIRGRVLLERVLIVTMSQTPGFPELANAQDEGDLVKNVLGSQVNITYLSERPTARQVKEQIQNCTLAHLACHGRVDPLDPAKSGLVFAQLGASGILEQDILTLSQLTDLDLREAKLAFLSACSTAENKLAELADEFLTVVSGFQIAGFRHVVGALWASFDDVCKDVSESFYSSLLDSNELQWNDRNVAAALHKAVLRVRARYPRQPLLWAQFIHVGS